MKLASLERGGRDGTLVVVDRRLRVATTVPKIAPTLQQAIDRFDEVAPALRDVYERLNAGGVATSFAVREGDLAAPLPRAYQFLDGSAYLNHVELVRRSRGAQLPPQLHTDPLMYQGGSDCLLGPRAPIALLDETHGLDFEAEVAVITDDVPAGTTADSALGHIRLVLLANDVSLRGLIPGELAKGFGFLQGKPPTAFSPVAVTPAELGEHFRDGKLHLRVISTLNGERFGDPNAGTDMHFSFADLIAHGARTRPLGAGTIVGSGTISNRDELRGHSCIAERRARELISRGQAHTEYLRIGDRIRIEALDPAGRSVFGAIEQVVVAG